MKRPDLTLLAHCLACLLVASASVTAAQDLPVRRGEDAKLQYVADELGNRIPDFSHCGFRGGDEAIPTPEATVLVAPGDGDDGARIQAAIDHVATLPTDSNGVRGVVQLAPGQFSVADDLRIATSGIVLRGSGADSDGTTLIAAGDSRRPLLRLGAAHVANREVGRARNVVDDYVPVGGTTFMVDDATGLAVGDRIVVTRPSTDEWIAVLGARAPGVGWRAGRCDVQWDRVIVSLDGNTVTVDAPLTTAIEQKFGGATVARTTKTGRLAYIGVEDLCLRSEFDGDRPGDEEHSWYGIVANSVENAWVRRVRFEHFAGGAILLREGVQWATVEDCLMLAPVSELAGYRRHSFFTQGQQTLFLRCHTEHGMHDFAVGHCAPGPNAFVNCYAAEANADSGPLESWASGVLYDNVRIDGGNLTLANRWTVPPGAGWSAANCVLWQCQAAIIRAFRPPTANNWVLGYWAEPQGDAVFYGQSEFVKPISLFQEQLRERRGDEAASAIDPLLLDPIASTNPTTDEAAEFAAGSSTPARTLRDVIEQRLIEAGDALQAQGFDNLTTVAELPDDASADSDAADSRTLRIVNGWITVDGRVLTGGSVNPTWWRGTLRPNDAPAFGPSITRFAPGRYGTGLTDDLAEVVRGMQDNDQVVYDHHYGLWYDRRRDDHLMVRRATAEVAPPFFEQPFARTGLGKAWDGLSRYDLTKPNIWYWQRLSEFAKLCDQHGLVLYHQHYFQHNILEAGSHWADSPWRPTNNVNGTPFPEPPPYVGDKRIFLAPKFYDTSDPQLARLHQGYVHHCLDRFADRQNVIHSISAEYTGPVHFTQFWLDAIDAWSSATGTDPLIALATTKDVQDAVLAEEEGRKLVDIIDIRYWCYDEDGQLYAPRGGINLSPRQQLRQSTLGPASTESVARAVREYRLRYPGKAVTYYADRYCRSPRDGWAVLLGGGSLAAVPPLPEELERAIPRMLPANEAETAVLQLADPGRNYLLYLLEPSQELELELPTNRSGYRATWIDPSSGAATEGATVAGGRSTIAVQQPVLWLHAVE